MVSGSCWMEDLLDLDIELQSQKNEKNFTLKYLDRSLKKAMNKEVTTPDYEDRKWKFECCNLVLNF